MCKTNIITNKCLWLKLCGYKHVLTSEKTYGKKKMKKKGKKNTDL